MTHTPPRPTLSPETERRVAALPVWHGTPEMEPLSGGLSNESVLVRDARGAHVVRLGRDFPFHHVERARETMVTRAAVARGFAPEQVHAEPGVMVTSRSRPVYLFVDNLPECNIVSLAFPL